MNPQSTAASRTASVLGETIQDPIERQGKLFGAYKQANEAKALKDNESLLAEKKDPNSRKSMALKALAPRWGLNVTPEMSAYDIEQMIDPKKMMETEAASKVEFGKQKALKEMDIAGDIRKESVRAGIDARKETTKRADEKAKGEKEFRGRYKSISDELAALDSLIDKKGTYEMFGSHDNELAQKIDSIAIDSAKLFDPASVARESEVAAFKQMLFEPGTLTTRNATAKDILKAYKQMLSRRAKSQVGEDLDGPPKKTVVNRKINKDTGQWKLIYDDGSEEIVNSNVAGR